MDGKIRDANEKEGIESVYKAVATGNEKVGYHSRYITEKYGDRLPYHLKGHEEAFALLYSAVGYTPDRVKRAMVRQTKLGKDKAVRIDPRRSGWKLLSYRGEEILTGHLEPCGEFLGKEYWRIDFSACREEGDGYRLVAAIQTTGGAFDVVLGSEPFDIKKKLLLNRTAYGVAVANLDERKVTHHLNPFGDPYMGGGWMDCSSNMSEVRHHPWVVFGCADLLYNHGKYLGPMICDALQGNLKWGLDHILDLQWEDGMFIDQYPDRHAGEWAHQTLEQNFYSPTALCIGYQVFKERDSARAGRYLEAAVRGYRWVQDKGRNPERATFGVGTTSGPTHILDKGNSTWTVADQSEMLWLETKLYECTGDEAYWARARDRAGKILSLQVVDPGEAVAGIAGDFYTFPGSKVRATETFERPIITLHGLLALVRRKPEDADRRKWLEALRSYAYKYIKPACGLNPFGIMPISIEKGTATYLRPHGRNSVMLQMAIQCLDLAGLFGDDDFLDLATNHIQWIVGLHHGIPGTFVQPQSYLEAVPASFINCVGSRFALQYQSPWRADAHHGPGGLVYWTNWRDNKRQLWTQYLSHPHPTILMGLASGEVTTEMFDDHFTNHREFNCLMQSAETWIVNDGLWLMTIARY